jgi:hypothetical protein
VSGKEKPESLTPPESLPADELPEQTRKEVRARYWKSPVPLPPEQEIHQRQHIPPVPEGEEVPDDTPSPPVELD